MDTYDLSRWVTDEHHIVSPIIALITGVERLSLTADHEEDVAAMQSLLLSNARSLRSLRLNFRSRVASKYLPGLSLPSSF